MAVRLSTEQTIERCDIVLRPLLAEGLKQWQALDRITAMGEPDKVKEILGYMVRKNHYRGMRYFDDTPEMEYAI